MKKMIIALMAVVMSVGVASAQNYMVVDSEKVFKSIEAYNDALEDIEKLATQYQDAVDKKFAEVENLYNTYISQRSSLSISAQQQYEQLILQKEAEATEYIGASYGNKRKTGESVTFRYPQEGVWEVVIVSADNLSVYQHFESKGMLYVSVK